MLVVNPRLKIPLREFKFSFARSSGPGGQNVNKVSTKATLRWPVLKSRSLAPRVRERLLAKYQEPGRAGDVARYFAMCEWFDETCGTLLNHLREKGLEENTIVAFICDNGWAARSTNAHDPNQKQWSGFALRSKGSPFEMGIRTPIMISWPAKVEPGQSKELAQSIDLFPTLAKACGASMPSNLPGTDLLHEQALAERTTIFGSMHSIHNMTVGDPDDTLQYQWCISGDWKLLHRHDGNDTTQYKRVHQWDQTPLRLYNVQRDPHETDNVAADQPQIVERLSEAIEAWHSVTP